MATEEVDAWEAHGPATARVFPPDTEFLARYGIRCPANVQQRSSRALCVTLMPPGKIKRSFRQSCISTMRRLLISPCRPAKTISSVESRRKHGRRCCKFAESEQLTP